MQAETIFVAKPRTWLSPSKGEEDPAFDVPEMEKPRENPVHFGTGSSRTMMSFLGIGFRVLVR